MKSKNKIIELQEQKYKLGISVSEIVTQVETILNAEYRFISDSELLHTMIIDLRKVINE